MQRELAASGLSPEEILAKTLLLQKAMAGDNSPAFINKTLKNALNVANLNKDDLTKVNKLWQLNINWNFRIDIKYVKYIFSESRARLGQIVATNWRFSTFLIICQSLATQTLNWARPKEMNIFDKIVQNLDYKWHEAISSLTNNNK